MVPGVRLQSIGVNLLGVMHRVMVHHLFDNNGQDRCRQRKHTGDLQFRIFSADDVTDSHITDAKSGCQQHQRQDGSKALKALLAVGMIRIPLLAGDVDADHDNDGGKYVGCRMHCIGDHGIGMGDNTRKKLESGQNDVPYNGNDRYMHGDLLACLLLHHRMPPFMSAKV